MKKRVLLLGNHGFVIYNFRKELIQKLISDGNEVYISLPRDEKVEIMISWGCKYIETNVDRRGMNPVTDLKLLFHYIKTLISVKPDVVLTYTIKPNLYGGLACRLLRIPCLNNITGLGSGFSKNSILKKILIVLYKMSLKKSSCVFFQNEQDMQLLKGLKVINGYKELIPGSGVNLKEYTEKGFPKSDVIKFIFIGRIMKDKGIDQYLEAAKAIKLKYPNTMFKIIGFVEKSQPHYTEMIKEYEQSGYVQYLGYQSDVKPFIEEIHCLIQPSHGGEGMSNVLLETGATGRVLIASNIAGCRETIDEGINGFTFEPQNTEHLIEKLERFIQLDNQEKILMGKNSREKIEREFNRDLVIKAYMNQINLIK